jgi:hypothetical protein
MRLAVTESRLPLAGVRGASDVAAVSAGAFLPGPQAVSRQRAQASGSHAAFTAV